ncbi:PilZ domain-containing protein [Desulfopila aestuarii]|uniref:PilZ domain-containing protein n=1 Tax=Desulfopila aestuarii DSM 18488 TaxID=1121416 RepID=A0A1M7YG00_9BACT|nr:PilZ domain-containing protein [Desulfopila aestuarii]SHO51438.1 PilZ domain-containing protein [Desulfopila aestuarii DSM 18488]
MSGQQGSGRGSDLRRVERRHLVFYLRVFDGVGSKVIGHIVDISSQGLMLISDNPVPVNENYRLRMRLPAEIVDKDEIIIQATSRWCKQDDNPDFYITGFQIYDLTPDIEKYITCLIEDFSFNDPV